MLLEKHKIYKQFDIKGEIIQTEVCKIGHINDTYSATFSHKGEKIRYIHQKINKSVFHDPVSLMENMVRVTTHLRRKLEAANTPEIDRRCLTLVPSHDGKPYYCDPEGEYWRTFKFIEGVKSHDAVEKPHQAFEAAKAFGEFQNLLVDLPGGRLTDTIPDFHNSRKRFKALQTAIEKDVVNRAREAKKEIDFALRHEAMVDVILDAMRRKEIPERITHNDTKFNNVMLDEKTGVAMCVVDLDTVMPGCSLYDFGDMVRSTTSPTKEDELDLSKIDMQMPLFQKLAEGYLSTAGQFLNRSERSHIAFSGKLITFTIGLRFLTDFLSGDTYFRIHRPNHNLDRCRTQFKLVDSIIRQEEDMNKVVENLCRDGITEHVSTCSVSTPLRLFSSGTIPLQCE